MSKKHDDEQQAAWQGIENPPGKMAKVFLHQDFLDWCEQHHLHPQNIGFLILANYGELYGAQGVRIEANIPNYAPHFYKAPKGGKAPRGRK